MLNEEDSYHFDGDLMLHEPKQKTQVVHSELEADSEPEEDQEISDLEGQSPILRVGDESINEKLAAKDRFKLEQE